QERALLENYSHAPAQFAEIVVAHCGDVLAEDVDTRCVGFDQSKSEFQDRAFAGTGHTENGFGLAVPQAKRNAIEHGLPIKCQFNVFEDHTVGMRSPSLSDGSFNGKCWRGHT